MTLEKNMNSKIGDRTGQNILLDEVEVAIKQLKEGKASDLDEIQSKSIILLNDEKIR